MRGFAVRAGEADTGGLRDVIDTDEHQIEAPGTNAARFEIEAKLVTELSDHTLEILGIDA